MLDLPEYLQENSVDAEVWRELNESYNFRPCDKENLAMLCHWHAVARQLMQVMTGKDGKKVTFRNSEFDLNPAFSPLCQAREEIAKLEKQLGIEAGATQEQPQKKVTKLEVIQNRRLRTTRTENTQSA